MGPLILNLDLLDASFCPAAHQNGNTLQHYIKTFALSEADMAVVFANN